MQRRKHPSHRGRPEHGQGASARPHPLCSPWGAGCEPRSLSEGRGGRTSPGAAGQADPAPNTSASAWVWPGRAPAAQPRSFFPLIGRDHQNLEDTDVTDGFARSTFMPICCRLEGCSYTHRPSFNSCQKAMQIQFTSEVAAGTYADEPLRFARQAEWGVRGLRVCVCAGCVTAGPGTYSAPSGPITPGAGAV